MDRLLTQNFSISDEMLREAQPQEKLQLAELILYASHGLSCPWWLDIDIANGERIYLHHILYKIKDLWMIL